MVMDAVTLRLIDVLQKILKGGFMHSRKCIYDPLNLFRIFRHKIKYEYGSACIQTRNDSLSIK